MDDSAALVDDCRRSLPPPTGGRVPRVSIGLPVYNGERWLAESVDSLLAQTFMDFELIISDNASTDGTAGICRRYAERDPRVRYFRNATNIGGMPNASLTFRLARGEYFRWASDDDRCKPTLLERLVEELDNRPEVVVAVSPPIAIDSAGEPLANFRVGVVVDKAWPRVQHRELFTDQDGVYWSRDGTASTASQRFREIMLTFGPCEATYGLIRSDVLRRTRLQEAYTSSDVILLGELALRGSFHIIDEPLFYKRWHATNLHMEPGPGRMAWSRPDLAESGKVSFPHWLQLKGHVLSVLRARLTVSERIRCGTLILRWARKNWRPLAGDIRFAGVMCLHSREWRKRCYAPESWTADKPPMSAATTS